MNKELILASRKREIPQRFSWVDHRLVQHQHFKKVSSGGMKLYLFLVTVGDADGLSFYGLDSLSSNLNMDKNDIIKYRNELVTVDLIAYKKPLYQVLDLSIQTKDETENFKYLLKIAMKNKEEQDERGTILLHANKALGRETQYKVEDLKDILTRMTGE
jgi:hypothetical protein